MIVIVVMLLNQQNHCDFTPWPCSRLGTSSGTEALYVDFLHLSRLHHTITDTGWLITYIYIYVLITLNMWMNSISLSSKQVKSISIWNFFFLSRKHNYFTNRYVWFMRKRFTILMNRKLSSLKVTVCAVLYTSLHQGQGQGQGELYCPTRGNSYGHSFITRPYHNIFFKKQTQHIKHNLYKK